MTLYKRSIHNVPCLIPLSQPVSCAGRIGYDDAVQALQKGGFNLSGTELQQLVMQLVDEMDEQGDIQ